MRKTRYVIGEIIGVELLSDAMARSGTRPALLVKEEVGCRVEWSVEGAGGSEKRDESKEKNFSRQ